MKRDDHAFLCYFDPQAYHVLHAGGVPDDHIIVMVYDDIANNPSNPRPGVVINHPEGQDLYQGLPKDYTHDEVNAANFLAVIEGDESAVQKGPHSSGRVINASKNDRIFVFYSDHGAPGILGMPSGDFLYADQLHHAIKRRHKKHGFSEMVLYIEACESGSMFEGMLENDLNVYATTAANSVESSWGVYCPGMDPSPPAEYLTCLGDLYSVAWMEDSEANDLTSESLKAQFKKVKQRTSRNETYVQGSHVMRYGELEIDNEPVSWYLGHTDDHHGADVPNRVLQSMRYHESGKRHAIHQRDADLIPLIMASQHENDVVKRAMAKETLDREIDRRNQLDKDVHRAVELLMSTLYASNGVEASMLLSSPIPAPKGNALVSDWDCLRSMMRTWQDVCGPLDQYGMKHSRAFANLCNVGASSKDLHQAAHAVCVLHQ